MTAKIMQVVEHEEGESTTKTQTNKAPPKKEKQQKSKSKNIDPPKEFDAKYVTGAMRALLKVHEKGQQEKTSKKSLLDDDGREAIHVQFCLEQAPHRSCPKPLRVAIPHAIWKASSDNNNDDDDNNNNDYLQVPEVCIIVKNDETKSSWQKVLDTHDMTMVKKLLTLPSLRQKYGTFAARRALLQQYSVFMVDDRIVPMVGKAIGKSFFQAKKQPIPIIASSKPSRLPLGILNALASTYFTIPSGTTISVRAGYTNMPLEQLVANVMAIGKNAVPQMPRKWANIRSMSVKTCDTVALPFYKKSPMELRELAQAMGYPVPELKTEREETEGADNEDENQQQQHEAEKKKSKKKSPLLKALQQSKKKKQEAKTEEDEDEGIGAAEDGDDEGMGAVGNMDKGGMDDEDEDEGMETAENIEKGIEDDEDQDDDDDEEAGDDQDDDDDSDDNDEAQKPEDKTKKHRKQSDKRNSTESVKKASKKETQDSDLKKKKKHKKSHHDDEEKTEALLKTEASDEPKAVEKIRKEKKSKKKKKDHDAGDGSKAEALEQQADKSDTAKETKKQKKVKKKIKGQVDDDEKQDNMSEKENKESEAKEDAKMVNKKRKASSNADEGDEEAAEIIKTPPKSKKKQSDTPKHASKEKKKAKTSPIDNSKPDDKNPEFMPSKKYSGSKEGYVFRRGPQGAGYYVDVKPVVDKAALEALARLKPPRHIGGSGKRGKQTKRRGRR